MNRNLRLALVGGSLLGVSFVASLATPQSQDPAGQDKHGKPAMDMPLPPGFTEADMQACIDAGTPGPMQEQLARAVGTWKGTATMWMSPEAQPTKTECTTTVKPLMDGRYVQCEFECDMPGMGPFHGQGMKAYDKVAELFQATWVDNHSTGIMVGSGAPGAEAGSMTWNYTYHCPITKQPAKMREVERFTGDDAMTVEMFATDPKSGKEYRMMEVAYTRTGGKPMSGTR